MLGAWRYSALAPAPYARNCCCCSALHTPHPASKCVPELLKGHCSEQSLCYAAGLSLPQAQVLAELFGGRGALLDPPRPATIKNLIAFQAFWDRHPQLFDDICQVGEQVVCLSRGEHSKGSWSAMPWHPVYIVSRSTLRCLHHFVTSMQLPSLPPAGLEHSVSGGGTSTARQQRRV